MLDGRMMLQPDRCDGLGNFWFIVTEYYFYTLNQPSRAGCPHSFGWRCCQEEPPVDMLSLCGEACEMFVCWNKRELLQRVGVIASDSV